MPRPPRLHVPAGHYHVILRGNHHEALFGDHSDRAALDEIVAEVIAGQGARLHAYCWMTNHLHALVQVGDRTLGGVVQRIAMRYSRYRHRKLRTTGHLFECRHRALLVDADAYLLTLLRYIHRNPVAAGLVTDPGEYPWSSHRVYLGADARPWVTTAFVLGLFHSDAGKARRAYRQFLAAPPETDAPTLATQCLNQDPRVLGSEDFLRRLDLPTDRPRSPLSLEAIARQICDRAGVSLELVRSGSRQQHLTAVRREIALEVVTGRVANMRQVANFFGRHASAVSQWLR